MDTYRIETLTHDFGRSQRGIASLGVFDGVHLGHQRILKRVATRAREAGVPSVVLTFAVHPVVVVRHLPTRLITSLPHRLRLFDNLGISECYVLPFDDNIRQLSAGEFAKTVFVDALDLQGLVLGPDARVGHDQEGDLDFLRPFCLESGIELEVVEDMESGEQKISSTRIRAAITDGDLERASQMLGRPFTMLGAVVKGEGRGKKLGFATANLDLQHEIRLPAGVYAIRARRIDGKTEWDGVLNIGIRPTFGPDGDLTVEAHLFDCDQELYGIDLELLPVARIRDEMAFESREQLSRQIGEDCSRARELLAHVPPVAWGLD